MPQIQLPMFPAGAVEVTGDLACRCEGEQVVYFHGQLPVFTHAKNDVASFRMFTSQLIVQGTATTGQVQRAFGVPLVSIKRATKLYRARGVAGFFAPKPRREGPTLTPGKLDEARALLAAGEPVARVGELLNVLPDTLRKAIAAGRLPPVPKKTLAGAVGTPAADALSAPVAPTAQVLVAPDDPVAPGPSPATSALVVVPAASPTRLSERSVADSQAPLGFGTTRVLDRMLAACGLLAGADLKFAPADDVPQAGVLCALPALLAEGLLRHTRLFYTLPSGYYPLEAIFLYLALLALVRCTSLEQTRYQAPGEWGRLLGLDRLPEVKTLRAKIALLCATAGQAGQWQTRLAQEWIAAATDPADPVAAPGLGLFYVDGHVRVYHGGLTSLPRRYVARQRLCLRGTTDYWVNGLGGEPFFVVTQPVNAGLLAALRDHVIPQLLASLPAVPASAPPSTLPAKASAPWVPRCTVVFDREGYSPEAFADYKACGVAILTYHKFPGEAWPTAEFAPATLRRHSGELVPRELAERGTRLSNGLWVREVRVVQAGDTHQTSILTTHPGLDLPVVAARMADRWTQENFLKYMRENFGLDRIIEHGTTPLPDTTLVVNPARRRLEADLRRHRADLQRSHARLGALVLPVTATPEQATAFLTQGGELRTAIATTTARLTTRQAERKTTPKKVALKELPANERFAQLCPESKHFIDTIKMIAYRAESALAGEVRETLARSDDARALLRRLFVTPANLRPDYATGTLTVELHRCGSALQDATIADLCATLTATETCFPTTALRLIYRQVGSP